MKYSLEKEHIKKASFAKLNIQREAKVSIIYLLSCRLESFIFFFECEKE